MTGVGIHVGKSVDPTFLRGEGLGTIVRTDAEVAGERGGWWWWGGESGWWEGGRGMRGGGRGGRGGRCGRCGRRVVVGAVVGVERIQWGVIDRTC